MTNIIIAGAKGRMGQALLRCAESIPGIKVTGQVDLGQNLRDSISAGDVVVDFTFHEKHRASRANLRRTPQGNGDRHHRARREGTEGNGAHLHAIPMVWTSNFSMGVNALFWLTRKAAEVLGSNFDVEVVEMHHRMKKDAPSGTAKTLAQIAAEARLRYSPSVLRHGREGLVGERTQTEIGVHSLRGGDVVGDHTVIFAANGERLELTHKASTRDTFASGALRAAQWVVGKRPGIYDMQDVLGLR